MSKKLNLTHIDMKVVKLLDELGELIGEEGSEFDWDYYTNKTQLSRNLGRGWKDLIRDQGITLDYIKFFAFISWGMADANTAFIHMNSHNFMVGTGECMRPFFVHYEGVDERKAYLVFKKEVDKLKRFVKGDE